MGCATSEFDVPIDDRERGQGERPHSQPDGESGASRPTLSTHALLVPGLAEQTFGEVEPLLRLARLLLKGADVVLQRLEPRRHLRRCTLARSAGAKAGD